jgi:hypothetical protein
VSGWIVELVGEESDLALLVQVSSLPAWAVRQGQDGAYYLESDAFEALSKPSPVHAGARELLPLVCATVKLSFRRVVRGSVAVGPEVAYEDASGKRTVNRIIHASASMNGGCRRVDVAPGLTPLNEIIAALRYDPHVVDTLRFFDAADERYWAATPASESGHEARMEAHRDLRLDHGRGTRKLPRRARPDRD